jgi:hypothetical protein
LERQGITDLKQINQTANFALLEWPDNLDVSDDAPSEYVPKLRPRFSESDWRSMHKMHALSDGWESMPFDEFLQKRRVLMAQIIKQGFDSLA